MRLRRVALLTALVTPAVLLGCPTVSEANAARATQHRASVSSPAKLLPSWARLENATGRTDGCWVSVALPFLQVPQQGTMTIELRNKGGCPKSANIHWLALSSAVYQLLPDGSRALIHPRGLAWTESSPLSSGPLVGSTGVAGEYLDCGNDGLSGQVTLIFNAKLRAWSSPHDPSQVFHAVVERQQTVDCT